MRLGDSFPPDARRDYVSKQLAPGAVLYLDVDFTSPPKPKYVVLACLAPTPLLLVINSQVNPNVEGDPARAGLHLELPVADYPFLDHDSFLDCSRTYALSAGAGGTEQVVADLGRIRGELNSTDRQRVVGLVGSARTLPPRVQRAIAEALSSPLTPPP